MTRAPRFHRPAGTFLVEEIATIPIGPRKGLLFSLIVENGVARGEILHCGLTPRGKAIVPERPQRVVIREEEAARIVEATAGIAVRLREKRP